MIDAVTKPKTKVKTKTERPKLHKVLLVNDDFTPRAFVVTVLRVHFRMGDDQAHRVMMTAHQRGVCVVAVFTRDIAEEKATAATEMGRPLQGLPAAIHDRARGMNGSAQPGWSPCEIRGQPEPFPESAAPAGGRLSAAGHRLRGDDAVGLMAVCVSAGRHDPDPRIFVRPGRPCCAARRCRSSACGPTRST